MAPTPYTPTHRLVFSINVGLLNHKMDVGCVADETSPGSGVWFLQNNVDAAFDVAVQDAVDQFWQSFRNHYPSSSTCTGWELQKHVSGIFPVVKSGTLTLPAGTGAANVLAGIVTATFKDDSNKRVVFRFSESDVAVPSRYAGLASGNPFLSFFQSVMDRTTPNEIGNWMRSRGNGVPVTPKFATGTISKKLRRSRNLL